MKRKDYIGIAKAIRDCGLSKANRIIVCRAITRYLREHYPVYDEYTFRALANAEDDKNESR